MLPGQTDLRSQILHCATDLAAPVPLLTFPQRATRAPGPPSFHEILWRAAPSRQTSWSATFLKSMPRHRYERSISITGDLVFSAIAGSFAQSALDRQL